MSDIADRLQQGAAFLEKLRQQRLETGAEDWGRDAEYAIVVAELWDLEEDILRDPGALKPELARVPRGPRYS